MKKIKVNLKPLVGINRTVSVFPSVDLMLRSMDLTDIVETFTSAQTDGFSLETIRSVRKNINDMLDFIQDMLKLTDKEISYFSKHSSPEDVGYVVGKLIMIIQGVDESQIEKSLQKHENQMEAIKKDPKK